MVVAMDDERLGGFKLSRKPLESHPRSDDAFCLLRRCYSFSAHRSSCELTPPQWRVRLVGEHVVRVGRVAR